VSALFGQTSRCSASSAGPRYFSVTATQPHASQAISRSAAFTARRVRAASPAGQSCSSNSRSAQRSEGRSQRRPQTPHDATPGLSSASSASSRRFALPQATGRLYRRGRGRPRRAPDRLSRHALRVHRHTKQDANAAAILPHAFATSRFPRPTPHAKLGKELGYAVRGGSSRTRSASSSRLNPDRSVFAPPRSGTDRQGRSLFSGVRGGRSDRRDGPWLTEVRRLGRARRQRH
jgi:hypothetical protein